MKIFRNGVVGRVDAIIFLICFLLLAAASQIGDGASVASDYAGDGDFSIRSQCGVAVIEACGINASMAFGQKLDPVSAFAGLDSDCEDGRFTVAGDFGLSHFASAYDMQNISARASIGGLSSLYNIAGTGKYRERVIDDGGDGCLGYKPVYLIEAEFAGTFEINTSAEADPIEESEFEES